MSADAERSTAETSPDFFRCPVQAEQSRALVTMGRRRFRVTVQDASIEGFTVLVEPKYAKRINVGIPWILEHEGAKLEIKPQWFFQAPEGHIQVGLRMLRDLTEPEKIGTWWPRVDTSRAIEDAGHSTLAFAGFALVLIVTMAMPGLGDKLGTSKRINATFEWVINGVGEQIGRIW